ncbi:MAG TPA: FAD-dependent oxidoreductase, partial [Marmoricola sp.]|nr:FAD-dependent oxidoreductase [Marmoricola sp.]
VHKLMRESGIDLRLRTSVTSIGPDSVTLDDGSTIPADLVVAAIGVRPDTALADQAGLRVDRGIVVDEFHRTSDPLIYAVGDAVEKVDALDQSQVLVPLANTANLQGRRVADHIAGQPGRGRGVLGTAIVGVLGLQIAATGWNEKRLREAGRPYRAIHTHPATHATYYPGADDLDLKLLVDPETDAILGAQAVGRSGADKRIDVIATAITGGLTASDLADLELAYAPQFSSAKDPVNMLGHIADNLRTGTSHTIQWHEVDGTRPLVDVRTPKEYADGSIPGAINIPVDSLRERLDELPDGDLIVYCAVGVRGHTAARLLSQHGRTVANLDGGYRTWAAAQLD